VLVVHCLYCLSSCVANNQKLLQSIMVMSCWRCAEVRRNINFDWGARDELRSQRHPQRREEKADTEKESSARSTQSWMPNTGGGR
jgi:hypothetical protein